MSLAQPQPDPTPTYEDRSVQPAIRDFGVTEYETAMGWQRQTKAKVVAGGLGEIGVFEHPALLTIGANEATRGEYPDELAGLALARTDRGGKITYHGPGQAVVYPVLDLRPYRLRAKAWVDLLESIGIDVLAQFGVGADRRPGCPGVWVGTRKTLAVGCNLRGGINTHGVSINVAVDLSVYDRFDPCGTKSAGLGVTDMRSELGDGRTPPTGEVGLHYAQRLADALEARTL